MCSECFEISSKLTRNFFLFSDVSDFEVERTESMELDEALRMDMAKLKEMMQKLNDLLKRRG